jgi:hypothetical protein
LQGLSLQTIDGTHDHPSGRGFSADKAPREVGHWFASVWQGVLDKVESHGGVRIPIDVNVAAVPSPSAAHAVGA